MSSHTAAFVHRTRVGGSVPWNVTCKCCGWMAAYATHSAALWAIDHHVRYREPLDRTSTVLRPLYLTSPSFFHHAAIHSALRRHTNYLNERRERTVDRMVRTLAGYARGHEDDTP